MKEQPLHNIVLELDFKIDGAEHFDQAIDLGRSGIVSLGMFSTSLVRYLSAWREQPRLLPKSKLGASSTYVFRKPTVLDENALVGSAFLSTRLLFDQLAYRLPELTIEEIGDLIQCEAIVIEYLGFGCTKGRIKYYLKVAGSVVTMLGALGGAISGAVALEKYFDPSVPAISASCTVHQKYPQDLGRELRSTIERYPYTWMASGNEACVKLRQQVLNHFLDTPIEEDGLYGRETTKAEKTVAQKFGLEGISPQDLYPFLAETLEEPQSILVIDIPLK